MSIQGISLHVERPNLSSDPVNQINTFRQYLNVLGDSQAKDENKLKAAQELNDSFDVIIAHPQYQTFLDHAMRVFLKLLQVISTLIKSTALKWFLFLTTVEQL